MISKLMEKALNEQMAMEAYASFLYLSMGAWCDEQGLTGCVQFLRRQSEEENLHMMKIYDYLSEVNARAIVPSLKQPPANFESAEKMFEEVYQHEQKVTRSIFKIVDLAMKENDHSTHNFLQWYIMEQREEESLMLGLLDKIKLIGESPMKLYYLDKEVEAINAQTVKSEN
jgi:ferritin